MWVGTCLMFEVFGGNPATEERTMTDGNKADDKNSGLLMSVAETIGSTLGSLAAKDGAAQKSIEETTSEVVRKVAPSKRKASAKKTKKAPSKEEVGEADCEVEPIRQARFSLKEQAFAPPVILRHPTLNAKRTPSGDEGFISDGADGRVDYR